MSMHSPVVMYEYTCAWACIDGIGCSDAVIWLASVCLGRVILAALISLTPAIPCIAPLANVFWNISKRSVKAEGSTSTADASARNEAKATHNHYGKQIVIVKNIIDIYYLLNAYSVFRVPAFASDWSSSFCDKVQLNTQTHLQYIGLVCIGVVGMGCAIIKK